MSRISWIVLLVLWPAWSAAGDARTAAIEAGEDALVLEEILEIDIQSPTRARERYARRTRILTPRGAEENEIGRVDYNPSRVVRELRGSVTSPQGKKTEVKKQFVLDHTDFASYDLYSDARQRSIRLPGAVPGAIVEYSYEVDVSNLFYLIDRLYLQDLDPVRYKRLTVRAPASLPLRHALRGTAAYRSEEREGWVTHTWEVRDVPALKFEPGMPPRHDLFPRVRFFPKQVLWEPFQIDSSSWQGVARWYRELTRERLDPSPDVAARARELAAGAGDPMETTRRLFEFAQKQVKYVSIQLGIGGYQPHHNAEVLKNGYGDCKDKATLLIAMMRAVGLRAYPVLIQTRDAGLMDRDFPAPFFNHAIVAVPVDEGYLFMDPTDEVTQFGDLPWVDQGTHALVVKEDGGGELVETPTFPPERNRGRRLVTAAINPAGDLTGTYVLEAQGQVKALYLSFLNRRPGAQEDALEDHMAWLCPGAVMQGHEITRPSQPKDPLRIVIRFEVPRFATPAGNALIAPPHLVRLKNLTDLGAYTGRRLPVFFEHLFSEEIEIRLTLPPGRALRKIPADRESRGPGVSIRTRHEIARESGRQVLVIKRSVAVERREIPVADYQALREFLSAVAQEEARAVTLDAA
jgi:transglutaminase-like putative cysteine protease